MKSLRLGLNFQRPFKTVPPSVVSIATITFAEEKDKATMMLKPSSKRKRNNVEIMMDEEEKSEASQ